MQDEEGRAKVAILGLARRLQEEMLLLHGTAGSSPGLGGGREGVAALAWRHFRTLKGREPFLRRLLGRPSRATLADAGSSFSSTASSSCVECSQLQNAAADYPAAETGEDVACERECGPARGLGVVALRDLRMGTAIFEKHLPLCFYPFPIEGRDLCWVCGHGIKTWSQEKSSSFYCSEECKFTFEKERSPPVGASVFARISEFFSSQDVVVALMLATLCTAKRSKWRELFCQWKDRESKELYQMASDAAVGAVLLSTVAGWGPETSISPELVLDALNIVRSNSFAVSTVDEAKNIVQHKALGVALYEQVSRLNHSCAPNAAQVFDGSRVTVVLLRELKAGEEVTISYGPMAWMQSREERQQILSQRYCFACRCNVCEAEGGESHEKGGEPFERARAMDRLAHSESLRGNFREAAKLLESSLTILKRHLSPNDPVMGLEYEKRADVYAQVGNWEGCFRYALLALNVRSLTRRPISSSDTKYLVRQLQLSCDQLSA